MPAAKNVCGPSSVTRKKGWYVLGDACWLTMRVDDTCWVVSIGLYFLYCISCIVFLVPILVPNYKKACGINFGIRY